MTTVTPGPAAGDSEEVFTVFESVSILRDMTLFDTPTDTTFTLEDPPVDPPEALSRTTFTGTGFSGFDGNLPTTGTITTITFLTSEGEVYQTYTGLSIDVAELNDLADTNDINGFTELLFGGNDNIMGGNGADNLSGYGGDDEINGDNDTFVPNGADEIHGGAGNDLLDGWGGADQVFGEEGDDRIQVYTGEFVAGETADGGTGTDTLESHGALNIFIGGTVVSIEKLKLDFDTGSELQLTARFGAGQVGGGGLSTTLAIEGTSVLDVVQVFVGVGGSIDLSGWTMTNWNDLALDHVELIGNSGNETLTGTSHGDLFAGGAGKDTFNGGGGLDSAYYGAAASAVTVNLNIVGPQAIGGGAGSDTYNSIEGVIGSNFDDTITGNAASNYLVGGLGVDIIRGGAGDDNYLVERVGDRTIEGIGAGTDTVYANLTWTIEGNVENLVLTGGDIAINGTGNALSNILTGNAGANTLDGKAGADSLLGGLGNDIYVVDDAGDVTTEAINSGIDTVRSTINWTLSNHVENLQLLGTGDINGTGNSLANTLTGNAGANILNGGNGVDQMTGGAGDDTYYVNAAGEHTIEGVGAGLDTVRSTINWTLEDNVENLILASTGVIATGNALENRLTGNDNANQLDGKAGVDMMLGGKGNDIYFVDTVGDRTIEAVDSGTDTVRSSITWKIENNIEDLQLQGTDAINGTGNTGANTITGNTNANVLDGGAGDDVLKGGSGADTLKGGLGNDTLNGGLDSDAFVFNTALGATNVDIIQSYSVAADVIHLENSIFTTIGANGVLTANQFVVGAAAVDADDHIIYDSATGALYYDADGNGAGAAVQFASMTAGLTMTHAEFLVI